MVDFSSWSLLERCGTASPCDRNISVCHVVYARPSETSRKIHSLVTDTRTLKQERAEIVLQDQALLAPQPLAPNTSPGPEEAADTDIIKRLKAFVATQISCTQLQHLTYFAGSFLSEMSVTDLPAILEELS